eukprot:TRINITY_DN11583_c0_g1_i1.p1 TRINITY_DN11583_c0_g1~~TRINITY_DN11583_c0_g1_i1.p1  ORF type:complete len:137 (-),score=28.67 TRINITY_DN11583_c0_g1_i1:44-454(-)
MLRRSLPLLCTTLGQSLRASANSHWKFHSDKVGEVDEKASHLLEVLTPRLERYAAAGAYHWQYEFVVEADEDDRQVLVLEDEYGFEWDHLTSYLGMYQSFFAKHGLKLRIHNYISENPHRSTVNRVRRIRVDWSRA